MPAFKHHHLSPTLIRALGGQILLGAVLFRGLLSSSVSTRRAALVLASGSTPLLFVGRRLSLRLVRLFLFRSPLAGVIRGTLRGCPRSFLLQIQNGPVKHVVVLKALSIKELLEESLQIGIIGPVLKAQRSAVFEIRSEFGRVSLAKLFGAGGHFSVHDAFVLLFLGVGFQSLPGKRSANEIHQDIPKTLEVVPTGLFDSNVGIDGSVSGGSRQVFVFAVGNVLVGAWIPVLFGQSEINNVNHTLALSQSNQEIVGLDISVNKGFRVDVFQSTEQLICKH
mmetsp:Transcript_13817/g.28512  ORF Transcript_13817/g.28512 Transcript_13817/m.28512 type:complete len:280 (-) Transcript_13817:601-1440(-)